MGKDGENIYVYKWFGLTLYYLFRYPDIKGKYDSCDCFYYIRKRIISDMKKDKHYRGIRYSSISIGSYIYYCGAVMNIL